MEHQPGLAATAVATSGGFADGFPCLDEGGSDLLAYADPGLGSRILVLLPGGLEVACALLRRGHTNVAMARLTDRPRTGQVDIAMMPCIQSAEFLQRAIPYAHRVLAALGTVVIHLDGGLPPGLVQQARRQLAAEGFAALHVRTSFDGVLLRAEMPLFGQLRCA